MVGIGGGKVDQGGRGARRRGRDQCGENKIVCEQYRERQHISELKGGVSVSSAERIKQCVSSAESAIHRHPALLSGVLPPTLSLPLQLLGN